ncbi:hypothetical protein PCANC_11034 [Puccinia coronata f. sp. avenae]|uniref:Uncharacterized protein n=1 Tax=Puccinia coronata f. sp. avenae TaxID=200324 RepID=A0A2N5UVW7_9BASI|nr:hypothetical protein PCANC_11034 [Puccinia coronata f. sp. avenae]
MLGERKSLEYFRNVYPQSRSTSEGPIVLQKLISYLARKESASLELLNLWCNELDNILSNEPTKGEWTIITYGLHTLMLKSHGRNEISLIRSTLNQLMEKMEFSDRVQFPGDDLPVWYREMFAPHTGFSTELCKFRHAEHD